MNSDEIIDPLDQASEEIKNKVAVWLSEDSKWVIEVILGHYINIHTCHYLKSYVIQKRINQSQK